MPHNLIVLVFDTLRYDAVFGDVASIPNLRRFADQSVVFRNAWGEGLPTIPFRRALFTGMRSYPWRHHMPDRGSHPNLLGWHAIPEAHTTIAEYLYARGYATQLVSDLWHMLKPTQNFTRGFVSWDFIRGQEGDTFRLGAASFKTARDIDPSRIGPPSYLAQVRDRQSDDDYFVSRVLDRAGQFVRDIQGAAPYCLWVESFSPHEFWDPPMRYADAYFQKDGLQNYIVPQMLNAPQVAGGMDALAQARRLLHGAPVSAANARATADDIARTKALYQGYCTFCDDRFGRFVETLERTGALDDTVVAVLSDHGTELWDKGQFGKAATRMYPYNTQMNLIIRHPHGEGAGTSVDAFVQNHDVLPTVLGLLGVPHPRVDGDHLWPLVVGGAGADSLHARDHVMTGWETWASVRDRDWNLLINTLDPAVGLKLFDRSADPDESENVAGQRPDIVRRQIARLEGLLGAPLPAVYQHRPLRGSGATPGGLRELRDEAAQPGERWVGSNQV